jgi:Clostripain family
VRTEDWTVIVLRRKPSAIDEKKSSVRKTYATIISVPPYARRGVMPSPKNWGIYVYFAADVPQRQMQLGAWRNLQALASAGSSDSVGITAMIDLPNRDTEYYLIPQKPPGIKRWAVLPDRFLPNVNSASTYALYDFIQWSHRNCPATNVALVCWGHGYALDDFDPRIQPSASFDNEDQDDDSMGRSSGRSARSFPGKRGQELKLLYDATHDSVLNNLDFAEAICNYNTRFRDGKKIQILGLDCCNMAMAEVLCEFQDCTEYAIAAETELPFRSWLSVQILQKFIATSHPNAEEFAKDAVRDFIGSLGSASSTYVGLSACNLGAFKNLEDAMMQLTSALYKAIDEPDNRAKVSKAWFCDVSFVVDGLIDLYSFCSFLRTLLKNSPVDNAALEVQRALDKVIVLSKTAPNLPERKIALSKGLSFWFPPWIQHPSVDYFQINQSRDYLYYGYPKTRFAQATGWDRFLYKLFYITQGQ